MINFLPLSNIRQGLLNMEGLLDSLWFKILGLIHCVVNFLDLVFAPLNYFGPAVAISTIAFITVILTKILTKIFKTKRYQKLQMEFSHWHNIRQEALKCEDYDKGKRLARNIDQAKLNQVYYNYFFEGFMLGIATKYLPILLVLAYVNEAYKSSNLQKLFGREYIFKFGSSNGEAVLIGAIFWFIVSVVLIFLGWFIIGRIYRKYVTGKKTKLDGEGCSKSIRSAG